MHPMKLFDFRQYGRFAARGLLRPAPAIMQVRRPTLDTPSPPAHSRFRRGADLFRVRASKLAESSALVCGRPFEPAPGNAGEGSLHFFLPFFLVQPNNRIRIIL